MKRQLLYYFSSLTSDMNHPVTQNPPVPVAYQPFATRVIGVRVHYFFASWLSVNSLSSPVNGYFEER